MTTPIEVQIGELVLRGELGDTDCAEAIAAELPIRAQVNVWGDEFYFGIAVHRQLDETATTEVDVGTLGYWPPGHALAVFFGPTPMSSSDRPVPASEVNIVGCLENARELVKVKHERDIEIRVV